jgi:hypothetical protein
VSFPEPTPAAYTTPPPSLAPLSAVPRTELAPSTPREAPAILHPSDRRGFSVAPPAPRYSSSVDQLAIGEIDQTLFDCPKCRRPLALGARRCPGCGSLLVRSVLAGKAALFVLTGALIGAVAGLGGGVIIGSGLAAAGAAPSASGQPVASTAPSATTTETPTSEPTAVPTATPIQSVPPTAVSMPVAVQSALGNVLTTNAKLATAEADLRSALAAPAFDASAVAATLRTVSAQSLYGAQLAGPVSSWSGGADLGAELAAYYGSIHDGATAALDNSVQNTSAYRAAAKSMADLLAARSAIDAAIGAAATAAGVTLPGATAP